MQEENYYNIKARVRIVKPNGFGFLSFVTPLNEEKPKDIYFHVSNILNEGMAWKDIVAGQNVEIACLTKSARGYFALGVTFLKPKKS